MLRWSLWLCLVWMLAGCNLGTTPAPTVAPPKPTTPAPLSCDEMVTMALNRADTACAALGRNEACYGNVLVQAEFQSGNLPAFSAVGDIVDLLSVKRLVTAPFDQTDQTWGVALLKAQANLPGTLPGQNITFVLYGDATLDNITPGMNAVVVKTGLASTTCANAPESALVIQSPEGSQSALTINGTSLSLGSTIYLTARQGAEMRVATIEGSVTVSAFNTTRVVQPGTQVRVALGGTDGLQAAAPPSQPEPFDAQAVVRAPLSLLDRQVVVPPSAQPVAPSAIAPPTAQPIACVPRGDWTFTYVIQSGDTLFRIASRFSLTADELQRANCLPDANLIQAGQTLRVPFALPTPTLTSLPPTITPTATVTSVPPTATPAVLNPNLRADQTPLTQGQCTTVRWDAVSGAQTLFEGQPTTATSAQVCPTADRSYTLLLLYSDGRQLPYAVRIQVILPPDPTATSVQIG
jgi:hypothetical protein